MMAVGEASVNCCSRDMGRADQVSSGCRSRGCGYLLTVRRNKLPLLLSLELKHLMSVQEDLTCSSLRASVVAGFAVGWQGLSRNTVESSL